MLENTVLAEVVSIVRTAAKLRPGVLITSETHLVEDLAIDSLDLVGVFLGVQDHFDLAIEDDDLPNLLRVGDIVARIANNRASVAA